MLISQPEFKMVNLGDGIGINPLMVIIGGTQYTSLCLKSFKLSTDGKHYQAVFRVTILDDFGVSADDVEKPYGLLSAIKYWFPFIPDSKMYEIINGIKAFWILQYRRGYNPFVNRIQSTNIFPGDID